MEPGTGFRVLGPLRVVVAGQSVPIPAAKHRVLLAVLLLRANQVVSSDELMERLWGDRLPGKPRATLQTYVQRVRRILRNPERVITTPDGYHIEVEPDELDLFRFRSLSERASTIPDPAARLDTLRQALAEWRGEPLADVPSDSLQSLYLPQLEDERLEVLERRFDLELRLGRHSLVIPELQAITDRYPMRERFSGQLILACYRSGRQADAFATYQGLKDSLADQLGVDPTEELRQLYQAILTNDPSVAGPVPEQVDTEVRVRKPHVPRELPADPGDFVGRERISDQIAELLTPGATTGVPLVVISGPPGAGKTALAVRVAHRLATQFPDGQMYADLRGFSTTPALLPVQVLSRFLISLGVPGQQVPSDPDELVTFYRTLLAGRKVLLLLDNVATPSQVRPLLPNSSTCAVLVTSRNELRGLTALQAARPFNLGVLAPKDSLRLLASIVGPRINVEPEAAADLAKLCDHLPLALRIVAANLMARQDTPLTDYVAELRRGNRLSRLAIDGDDEAAVRAAFGLSYATLPLDVARMFRMLGLCCGPDFTAKAAAALVEVSTEDAAGTLEQLVVANLVSRGTSARYGLHDLVRLYAIEVCHGEESAAAVAAARDRLFRFYLAHVDAAAQVLYPVWLKLPRPDELPVVRFTDAAAANSWMDRDFLNVTAAIVDAAREGPRAVAWQMAESLRPYLVTRGRYRAEGLSACTVALHAAVGQKDHRAEAAIHNTLAAVYARHGEISLAFRHYTRELQAHRASGFVEGQARALIALGNVYQAMGKLGDAADHIQEGLGIAEHNGNRLVRCFGWLNLSFVETLRGHLSRAEKFAREALLLCGDDGGRVAEGEIHSILGTILVRRGRCAEAIEEFTRALDLYQRHVVLHSQADLLGRLSAAHRELGHYEEALWHADQALRMARDVGSPEEEADALTALASAQHCLGRHRSALTNCDHALELARQIGHVRAEITALFGRAECSLALGDIDEARAGAQAALTCGQAAGFRVFEGQTRTLLAWIGLGAEDAPAAAAHAGAALDIHRDSDGWLDHARALHVLGLARQALGDDEAAQACWRQALDHLDGVDIPDVNELHRLLAVAARSRG